MGVLTISSFSFICLVSALALQNQANFEIVEGMKVVNVTKTIQSVSQISCAASCLSLAGHGECKVADYHSGTRECHLSSQTATVENETNEWKLLIITGTSFTPSTTTATPITTTATPSTTSATLSTTTVAPATTTATTSTGNPCINVPNFLVSGSNPVPHERFTASSSYYSNYDLIDHHPSEARLNNTPRIVQTPGVWAAGLADINQYIQVDFTTIRVVTAIATKGRYPGATQYVTSYRLLYSANCVNFGVYKEPVGFEKVFNGNSDTNTVVINNLGCPFSARCVRLNPTQWIGHISMRFDVLGCNATSPENGTGCSLCTSTYYLVNGPMPVSDDNMTASSFYNDPNIYLGPSAARFWDTKAGIWAPMVLDTIQYIQVDFETIRYLTAIATQDRSDKAAQYVTAYRLLYSANCVDFTTYNETSGADKIFSGNSDANTTVVHTLPSPVYARCVRINPTAWQNYICIRFDVVGC